MPSATPRPKPPRHDAFAVCAPGLEAIVAGELQALGLRAGAPARGGVPFKASNRQLYLANAWLRCASRVLVRVARFRAASFEQLERRLASFAWDAYVGPDVHVACNVTSHGSRLYHTDAIAERVTRVVAPDNPPADAAPEQVLVVRVVDDDVTVSVDSSGDRLHRRGWRLATAKAPLRETLAAAVCIGARYDGSVALLDPFCGSGTIAIEAALLASGVAPGASRAFGFERWPSFEPGSWASVRAGLRPNASAPPALAPILGTDRDAGAIEAAEANAERAGVGHLVRFAVASLSDAPRHLAAPAPGWVLTNPPYGERVGGETGRDLRDLYAAFGALFHGPAGGSEAGATGAGAGTVPLAGWRAGMLVADLRLAGHARLPWRTRFTTTNGGIAVTFVSTDA